MNKLLQKAKIIETDLFKVEGGLVSSYNASLKKIIGKKTSLKEFSIDKRGVSPEIQAELGESYLQTGPTSRYVIIVSPEQKSAPLITEEFSFDDSIINLLFEKNQPEINFISRKDSMYSKIDDGLGIYTSLEDMIALKNITLDIRTPTGLIDKAAELNLLIKNLKQNPELLIANNSEHVTKLHALAQDIGDVRGYKLDNIKVQKSVDTFYTTLFDGAHIFKNYNPKPTTSRRNSETSKTRINDLRDPRYSSFYNSSYGLNIFNEVTELEKQSAPTTVIYGKNTIIPKLSSMMHTENIDFIPLQNHNEVINFLIKENLVNYSNKKIAPLLKRIEDVDVLNAGYVLSKLSIEEKERALSSISHSNDWRIVRKIYSAVINANYELDKVLDSSVPGYLRASLLEVKATNPEVQKTVSNLLSAISFFDLEEMNKWNKPYLVKTFENSSRETKQYIIDTLK